MTNISRVLYCIVDAAHQHIPCLSHLAMDSDLSDLLLPRIFPVDSLFQTHSPYAPEIQSFFPSRLIRLESKAYNTSRTDNCTSNPPTQSPLDSALGSPNPSHPASYAEAAAQPSQRSSPPTKPSKPSPVYQSLSVLWFASMAPCPPPHTGPSPRSSRTTPTENLLPSQLRRAYKSLAPTRATWAIASSLFPLTWRSRSSAITSHRFETHGPIFTTDYMPPGQKLLYQEFLPARIMTNQSTQMRYFVKPSSATQLSPASTSLKTSNGCPPELVDGFKSSISLPLKTQMGPFSNPSSKLTSSCLVYQFAPNTGLRIPAFANARAASDLDT